MMMMMTMFAFLQSKTITAVSKDSEASVQVALTLLCALCSCLNAQCALQVKYGRLLIATGLKPMSLAAVDPLAEHNVTTLRTVEDYRKIKGAVGIIWVRLCLTTLGAGWWHDEGPARTLTIVGGGLLGSELAWVSERELGGDVGDHPLRAGHGPQQPARPPPAARVPGSRAAGEAAPQVSGQRGGASPGQRGRAGWRVEHARSG